MEEAGPYGEAIILSNQCMMNTHKAALFLSFFF